jgi:hypothetical protein
MEDYSRDSSVDIVTSYWLDCLVSISGRRKIFLFSTAIRPPLGPTKSPAQSVAWALSPGVKRPGRKTDNSPPSSAEAKNGEL